MSPLHPASPYDEPHPGFTVWPACAVTVRATHTGAVIWLTPDGTNGVVLPLRRADVVNICNRLITAVEEIPEPVLQ